MYTSRNYSSYKRYNHTLHSYDNPPLEVLKQRRAKEINEWRKIPWMLRILIKAHYELTRRNLLESGVILEDGSIII